MYTRLKTSDCWHWHADCANFPAGREAIITRKTKPTNGELCDLCLAKDKKSAGALPDEDRRAPEPSDELLTSTNQALEHAQGKRELRTTVLREGNPNFPDAGPPNVPSEPPTGVVHVTSAPPPTGVRSPANREIDIVPASAVLDLLPGTPVPPLVPAPVTAPVPPPQRVGAPTIAQSVETRGPLVPLSEVHPSTVESAVREQRIPNDQIHAVFEDANGVKRDALGHVIIPG